MAKIDCDIHDIDTIIS